MVIFPELDNHVNYLGYVRTDETFANPTADLEMAVTFLWPKSPMVHQPGHRPVITGLVKWPPHLDTRIPLATHLPTHAAKR